MTKEEEISLDRIVGRLEGTVGGLKDQIGELLRGIENDRRQKRLECDRHWALTNTLSQDMALAKTAGETVEDSAKAARETIVAEAVTAAARVAREATVGADVKAERDAVIAAAVAASAEAARIALEGAVTNRRTQQHWLIERGLPFVLPIGTAVIAYLAGRGDLG